MTFHFDQLLTVTFTLFAVIDIVGSIPLLISLKEKMGVIKSFQATAVSGALMILFLFAGKPFLQILGLDIRSFAVGGSVVIFLLGLEMVLGHEIFKGDKNAPSGSVVPIAFPIIAGSGTLTTIMSLKANFEETYILSGILINLIVVYVVLKSLKFIEHLLGPAGLLAVRKFFGVILLAIAVKIFSSNIGAFGKITNQPMALLSKTIKSLRKQLEPGFWLAALTVLFLLPENIPERSLCVFSLLGFGHCPGCGIGHSIHYALHLQLSLSFHHHPLGIFGVLVIFNRLKQLIYPAKTAYETQSH